MNRLFWILLALTLYLVALMGCGSLMSTSHQCYDSVWTDCVVTVSDLAITSAGTDLGAVVTLSDWELIEGTVVVNGEKRSFSAYASGICDAVRNNGNVSGGVDVFFSYDESIVVRRQDFLLFSGEANVTATGDSSGTFAIEATVEDIGGMESPPKGDAQEEGSPDGAGLGGEGSDAETVPEEEALADDTRDVSMTLHASTSEHTEHHCSNDD